MTAGIRPTLSVLAAGLVFAAAVPAAGGTGLVKDADGNPVKSAKVCHFQYGVEQLCVVTNELGEYELMDSDHDVRIIADGFLPKLVAGRGHHEVVLLRYAILFVRLLDADTEEPIDKGEVFVVYGSAVKRGPFPTNRAGVRVNNVLGPGEVRLLGSAEGYEDSAPYEVKLKPGKESTAILKLKKKSGT